MKPEASKAGLAGLSALLPAALVIMQTSKTPEGWWAGVGLIVVLGIAHVGRALVALWRLIR